MDGKSAPIFLEPEPGSAPLAAYWVTAQDGVTLRLAVSRLSAKTKGTVFILTGRTEYIEKIAHVCTAMAQRGFSSISIDWRGQGLSDRLTKNPIASHVASFLDYQHDVNAMLLSAKALDLPKPWFMLAYSMGATIGLRAIQSHQGTFSAAAFTGPLWDLNLSSFQRLLAWPITAAATAIGFGSRFAPGNLPQRTRCYVQSVAFDDNRLTCDKAMFQRLVDQADQLPDHQVGAPTMSWVKAALNECRALRKTKSPDLAAICFLGERDHVVSPAAAQKRMTNWPNGRLIVIEGAQHDVLSEVQAVRTQILDEADRLFSQA